MVRVRGNSERKKILIKIIVEKANKIKKQKVNKK